MLVTLSGIVMLVNELHSKNASLPMLVTPFGITTSPPLPIYFCNFLFLITKSCSFIFIAVPFVKFVRASKNHKTILLLNCIIYQKEMQEKLKNAPLSVDISAFFVAKEQ